MAELRTAAALVAILTLPGWMLLTVGDLWRRWDTLQRWCLAIGLSVAFWPILFYWSRYVLPGAALGASTIGLLLACCAAVTAWRLRHTWREQVRFDRLEWVAIGILAATVFTRFWVIRGDPYPAWSDSLHHAILTQLTAAQGRLPADMEPYFPISLRQYHLGLYALSAVAEWLARVPAHEAVLYIAQALSALCGVGVYLVLDRRAGRTGAVVGTAVVGLLSHQPSLYMNWGRFTQLASQTVLLIAWLVTWEALASWRLGAAQRRATLVATVAAASALTAGVFLLHFRVAAFYVPLIAIVALWEVAAARRQRMASAVVATSAAVALGALVIVWPALWGAARVYVGRRLAAQPAPALASPEAIESRRAYYEFPLSSVSQLAAHTWLIAVAAASALVGIARRNRVAVMAIVWVVALVLLGEAYALSVPLLRFTNMGAVLVLMYLPIGLLVGVAAQEIAMSGSARARRALAGAVIGVTIVAGAFAARDRAGEIEPYRHFVTPADIAAMAWIRDNTPEDAVFAVNTTFWLPRAPHGTDGGYWIPYFTGRHTTAGAMIQSEATPAYQELLVAMSRAEERLADGADALGTLRRLGVRYIYVGKKGDFSDAGSQASGGPELGGLPMLGGDFSGPGLDAAALRGVAGLRLVYERDGVAIFEIK